MGKSQRTIMMMVEIRPGKKTGGKHENNNDGGISDSPLNNGRNYFMRREGCHKGEEGHQRQAKTRGYEKGHDRSHIAENKERKYPVTAAATEAQDSPHETER